jgi:hypothetical protein
MFSKNSTKTRHITDNLFIISDGAIDITHQPKMYQQGIDRLIARFKIQFHPEQLCQNQPSSSRTAGGRLCLIKLQEIQPHTKKPSIAARQLACDNFTWPAF